jgi:hypothetical protein
MLEPSLNLAALPAAERQLIEIDKRAAFVMWSMVLEQPRKKKEAPMTRDEINAELQAQQPEHKAYHQARLRHWLDHYTSIKTGGDA